MACSSGGDKRFTSPSNSALGHRLSWQFARVDGRYGRCNMLKHTVLCYLAKTFPDGMRFSPHLGGNIAFLDHWFHPPCLSHPQCAFQPSPVSAKKHPPPFDPKWSFRVVLVTDLLGPHRGPTPDGWATCGHLSDMPFAALPTLICALFLQRSSKLYLKPVACAGRFFSLLFKFLKKNMCCRIKETCDDLSYLENKPATARWFPGHHHFLHFLWTS